jgi:hypothetical protein
MKYVYLDITQNRVVCIHKKHSPDHANAYSEYIVSDDFDMSTEVEIHGELRKLPNTVDATEFIVRFNNDYRQKRINEYPKIEDQLDTIYHEGLDAWKTQIQEIKNRYPKS